VLDPAGHLSPDVVEARAFGAVEALAALHGVRIRDETVLTPAQELERWIPTMRTVDAGLRAGSEAVEAALLGSVPPPTRPAIVHGDFRLGNTLCTGGSVNVVIDWEIWSVGDPRVDLGWMALFCDPGNFPGVGDAACPMPSAQALRAAYEQATGQRAERFGWFESLARYQYVRNSPVRSVSPAPNERDRAGQTGEVIDDVVVAVLGAGEGQTGAPLPTVTARRLCDTRYPLCAAS